MDPVLARARETLDATRLAANLFDDRWRLVHTTDAQVLAEFPVGTHALSTEFHEQLVSAGTLFPDELAAHVGRLVPYMLSTSGGDRGALKAIADVRFHELIETVDPVDPPQVWTATMAVQPRGFGYFPMRAILSRLDRADGSFAGVTEVWVPNLTGEVLAMVALADPEHLDRVARIAQSKRRPSAILFADLEASTPLARRLSTSSYFTLMRRVMRELDKIVLARGGVVGRHVGDGLTAYFPAELAGGEAQAARAAITAARELPAAVLGAAATVASAGEVRVNAAIHWGATVRLGAMLSPARFEVTALGEEVNEAARMEACASGGRLLCSKALVERLEDEDAAALGVETDGSYLTLADVPDAPEKARRDAPTLAVREL